jgi:hypothetical protein
MKKCVHCLCESHNVTKDHVFPSSWYPNDTPATVQRWTVPSCLECNGRLGALEEDLFIRLALCVGPAKADASGISRKVLESFGVGVHGLSVEEKAYRVALRDRIIAETAPIQSRESMTLLPGMGPHEGFPIEEQMVIPIPQEPLLAVSRKVVRGCEYKLNRKRYIEKPYKLNIYFVHDQGIERTTTMLDTVEQVALGPGFAVSRLESPPGGPSVVLYRIIVWGKLKIYASIDNDV